MLDGAGLPDKTPSWFSLLITSSSSEKSEDKKKQGKLPDFCSVWGDFGERGWQVRYEATEVREIR